MDVNSIASKAELKKLLKRQSDLFYEISKLEEKELSVEQLLAKAESLISKEWVYEGTFSVVINYFEKANLEKVSPCSEWSIEKEVSLASDAYLNIQIYSENKYEFSEAEEKLLEVLTHNLSAKVDSIRSDAALKAEEEMLDKAYKLANIGTWEYDMINDLLYWSDVTKEVHGFGPEYTPDVESTISLFKEGYHRDTFAKAVEDAIEREIPFDLELKIISGKGDERWIRATGEPEYKNGECIRFYGISQNVTARRKAEEEIELNDRRFKAMMKHGMDMIAILDKDANYKYVSPTSKNVLGLPPSYFDEKNAFDFIHKDDKDRLLKQFEEIRPRESVKIKPFRFLNAENKWRWLEATITNLNDDPAVKGYISNSRDVTEQQVKQKEIIDSLKEKETLLAEIHHRVKNNLSVLTGLLQLQAANESNEEVLDRLFDSVARIHTMASIHEQLYQTNNFSSIDLGERIKLLALNIQKSFQSTTKVDLDFQFIPVDISVPRALPCSLIANEVLTNIFKHAFTDRKEGKVKIELLNTDVSDYIKLSITDNGKGLPKDFDPQKSESLGLSLIDMLSEQIKAEYFFEDLDPGTGFTLLFRTGSKEGILYQ